VEYVVHFDPLYNGQRAMLTGIGMAYFQEAAVGKELQSTTSGIPFHETTARTPDALLTEDRPWIVRFTPADRVRAERLLSDMMSLFTGSDPARAWLLKAALISLLALARHHGHPPDETPAERTEGWPTLHRALDCIHQRFPEPDLDNSRVAHAAGLTPNHLSRVFREHFGFTLRKYLTQVRIEQAKRMLADGSRSITDVAEQAGFSGIHAFSRAFHRETGQTPSHYRAGT
jgi:AraC-like DNA-binding protein